MSRYFIKTYGCQMNVNDSEVMAGFLERAGYESTADLESADIVLVNTCSIRERAEKKAISFIGDIKRIKQERPELKVGVCGCMAAREKEAILKELPFVDLVLGPRNLAHFDNVLLRLERGERILEVDRELPIPDAIDLPMKRTSGIQAWVTVMYGCDHNCTYCIVPFVRGREVSRPKESIVREVEELDKSKHKEVVLLGQNIDSYGKHLGYGLDELLRAVSEVPGVERVRFLTSHPHDLKPAVIDAVRDLPKVCEYFHLPIQHGDNAMLRRMARIYTIEYYRKLVDMIRSAMPDAAITTDFIVGFPGETEEQFERTVRLVEEIEFDLANTAAYSPRPGTVAATFPDQVSAEIKNERLNCLNEVVNRVALKKNLELVNSSQEVLIEKVGESETKKLGRTRGNKWVIVEAPDRQVGETVSVEITGAKSWQLVGEVTRSLQEFQAQEFLS